MTTVTRFRLLSPAVLLMGLIPLTAAHGASGDAGLPSSAGTPDPAEGLPLFGCMQEISATVDNKSPTFGQVVTFTVTVTNHAPEPAPLDLWLHASGQHTNLFKRLVSGAIGGNTTVTRDVRVRVPSGPIWLGGSWVVNLNIGDFDPDGPGEVCDTASFWMQITLAPSEPEDVVRGFEVVAPNADFFTEASALPAAEVVASPNPFAHRTAITFEVAEAAPVRLVVYDVLGREVAVLVDGPTEAGRHAVAFDGRGLPPGTYVYRLAVGEQVSTGRLMVAR